jgi:hypothetical protein
MSKLFLFVDKISYSHLLAMKSFRLRPSFFVAVFGILSVFGTLPAGAEKGKSVGSQLKDSANAAAMSKALSGAEGDKVIGELLKGQFDLDKENLEMEKQDRQENKKRNEYDRYKESCNAAKRSFDETMKELKEACGDYGIGADCIEEAEKCEEGGSEGGSSSAWSGLGSMLSTAGTSFLGLGSLESPSLFAEGSGAKCKREKSIQKMKDKQEKLYENAKEAKEDADRALEDVQKDADKITDLQSEAQKDYQKIMKALKEQQIKLPGELQKKKDDAANQAMEIQALIGEQVKARAGAQKELELSQSLVSRLYPALMGECMDAYTGTKLSEDQALYEIRQKFEEDLAKLDDLRQRNAKIEAYKRTVAERTQFSLKIGKAKYDQCVNTAKARYQAEYNDLNEKIIGARSDVQKANATLDELQRRLADVPNNLAKVIDEVNKMATMERESGMSELQGLQATLQAKIQSHNERLSSARQKQAMKEYSFMKGQSAYTQAQAISEASLGNVAPLLSTYRSNKNEWCDACSDLRLYATKNNMVENERRSYKKEGGYNPIEACKEGAVESAVLDKESNK